MNRVWFVAALLCLVAMQPVSPPEVLAAEKLCREPRIESLYVNFGMANDSFGRGLEDVFEVDVVRARPATDADVAKYKNFNYFQGKDQDGNPYADGRQYVWRQEGPGMRLYRKKPGARDQRIEFFAVRFSDNQTFMRLRAANPKLFSELHLDSTLKVLGVMGVTFRGAVGTVDFINALDNRSNFTLSSSTFNSAYVLNADTMLYRFARSAGFQEVTSTVLSADIQSHKGFYHLMSRQDEKAVLQNYGALLHANVLTDDREKILTDDGRINELPYPVRLVYEPCRPDGDEAYGAAKGMFLPVVYTDNDGPYLPLLLFPGAFSSVFALNDTVSKVLRQARWWAAASQGLDASKKGPAAYELIMRLPPLHYAKTTLADRVYGQSKYDLISADWLEFRVTSSLDGMALTMLDDMEKNPDGLTDDLPLMGDPLLLTAAPLVASRKAEYSFASAVLLAQPKFSAMGDAGKIGSGAARKIEQHLIQAIVNGYLIDDPELRRDRLLKHVKGSAERIVKLASTWKPASPDQEPAAKALFEKLEETVGKTPLLTDGEYLANWFGAAGTFAPLAGSTFGKRLLYLVDDAKVTGIKGMDSFGLGNPVVVEPSEDKEIEQMLREISEAAGEKVSDTTSPATGKEAEEAARLEMAKKLRAEMYLLSDEMVPITKKRTAASEAQRDEVDKGEAVDAAWENMLQQCGGKEFRLVKQDIPEGDFYQRLYTLLQGQVNMVPCVQAANQFIDKRSAHERGVADKAAVLAAVSADLNVLKGRLEEARDKLNHLNGKTVTPKKLKELKKILAPRGGFWNDWILQVLNQYFYGTYASEEQAFAVLKDRLDLVPGVSLATRTAGGAQP